MKTYWGSEGIAPRVLNLGIRLGEWIASRPDRFIPCYLLGRTLSRLRIGLDAVAKLVGAYKSRESHE